MSKLFSFAKGLAIASFAVFSVYSCQKSEDLPPQNQDDENAPVLSRMEFTVSSSQTKTLLGEDGVTPEWIEGEQVSVFDASGNRPFKVEASGASSTISGDANSDAQRFYALFPYDEDAVVTFGQTVTVRTSVASEQTAVAGSFAPSANLSAAVSDKAGNFSFKNLLSIAKITVDASLLGGKALSSVTLESKEYPLSGEAIVSYSESGIKVASTGNSSKKVTLSAEEGKSLSDGDYYLALLPNQGGDIVLTFTAADGYTAVREATLGKPFTAGVIKNLGTAKNLDWKAPVPDPILVPAGTLLWGDSFDDFGTGAAWASNKAYLSTYDYAGRQGYGDNATSVTINATDNVKGASGTVANVDGGHLWLYKGADGTFETSDILLYGATKLKLSYSQGTKNSHTKVYYQTDGDESWTELVEQNTYSALVSKTFTVPEGSTSIRIKFTNESTSAANTRVDNIELTTTADAMYTPGSGQEAPQAAVVTLPASDVTATGATLSATYTNVTSFQGAGFYVGTSSDLAALTSGTPIYTEDVIKSGSGSFSANATSLETGIPYYFVAFVEVYDESSGSYKEVYGSVQTFFTEAPAPVIVDYGWLELPSYPEASDNVHIGTFHDGSLTSDVYVSGNARNYTYYYDKSMFTSMWAAYPLYSSTFGGSRSGNWAKNPNLSTSEQINVWTKSYGVDYAPNNTYARGHGIPDGDRSAHDTFQAQTYFVTNSTPQVQNSFNGGIWSSLEGAFRTVASGTDTVYVVTGVLFYTKANSDLGGGEEVKYIQPQSDTKECPVPNYYWKAGLKVKRNSQGEVTSASTIAFWFENMPYSDKYPAHTISLETLEKRTGFNFYVNLPSDLKEAAKKNSNWTTFSNF